MFVKFHVIQQNKKGEQISKFIEEVDLVEPLMNNYTYELKGKFYVVMEQTIMKSNIGNYVHADCHEFIPIKNEKSEKRSTS